MDMLIVAAFCDRVMDVIKQAVHIMQISRRKRFDIRCEHSKKYDSDHASEDSTSTQGQASADRIRRQRIRTLQRGHAAA